MDLRRAADLHKTMECNDHADEEIGPEEPVPQFFRMHDRARDHKIEKEVRVRDQSLHALIVGPEALVGILSKNVCRCDHRKERTRCAERMRIPGTIRRIEEHEERPGSKHHLNEDPKRKILSGDERKEHILRNNETDKGRGEEARNNEKT